MKKGMSINEFLYRKHTKAHYISGLPHPLKAVDQIKFKLKTKRQKKTLEELEIALEYAKEIRRKFISLLKSEERFLLKHGWKRRPCRYDIERGEDFMGDNDGWSAPMDFVETGRFGAYITKKGQSYSRCGALSCQRRGIPKNKYKGEWGEPKKDY
jgi:hypothetical protein